MQIQIDRATIDTLEASKPLLAKPLSSTLERIMESAREPVSDDTAAVRTVEELMQGAASRKSRLTAAEFLSRKPESRK